jgi:hypothetical protein
MATPPLAINETCAVCGRLLFTALLGGKRLVRMGQAWYHAECVHPEEGNDADATGSQAEMGSEN